MNCPYKKPELGWVNNPREWPNVVYEDIFEYLIRSPSVSTGKAVQNCKSMRSERLATAGWVNLIKHYKIDDSRNLFVMKAIVTPSMKINCAKHTPWLVIGEDGYVVTAHCTCYVGTDETCSHVGGLLYKIEMTCRMGLTRPEACTDRPCEWNQVAWGGVEMDTLAHIQMYKETAAVKDRPPPPKVRRPDVPPTEEQKQEFLDELLHLKELPCVLSTFGSTAAHFVSRKPLPVTTKMPTPLREQVQVGLPPKVSRAEADFVEKNTRQQERCLNWYIQREGRITSSIIYKILHTSHEHPANYIILLMCTVSSKEIPSESIRWGHEHEKDAISIYQQSVASMHAGFEWRKSGLYIKHEDPVFGASPDGIVSCHCCGTGVVEVKCPFSLRDKPIEEWHMKPEVHGLSRDMTSLTEGHAYELQIQHHLYITGLNYCDYVVWTTKGCCICRIMRRPEYEANVVPSLKLFWLRHVEPELLTQERAERKRQEKEDQANKTPFCPCGKPDNKQMVGCDGASCEHEWFHFRCVGLKGAPSSKTWLCKDCKPAQGPKGKVCNKRAVKGKK